MMIELQEGVNRPIVKKILCHCRDYEAWCRTISPFTYECLLNSDLYYMSKFEKGDEGEKHIQLFSGSVRMLLPTLFQQYKGIIMIISLGAVVTHDCTYFKR